MRILIENVKGEIVKAKEELYAMKERFIKKMLSAALCLVLSIASLGSVTLAAGNAYKAVFRSFTGRIHGVTQDGLNAITVESKGGARKEFTITSFTYVDKDVQLVNGADVICFYNESKTPDNVGDTRFNAGAIVKQANDVNVTMGRFDEELVNENNTLKLLNTDKAEVTWPNGDPYEGALENQILLVYYGPVTKSIPAQTNPIKIVVFRDYTILSTEPARPERVEGAYGSFTGKVTNKSESKGITYVMLTNEQEMQTRFAVTPDTIILNDAKLTEGETLTGFYDLNGIAPAIYPPQYIAFVIAKPDPKANLFVGLFDETLTSADRQLKLLNIDKAEITDVNGKPYTGPLEDQTLAVYYDIATFSIPAETNPMRIVVLSAENAAPEETPPLPITVNGHEITDAAAFDSNGVMMVPLRAVAQALGHEITWNGADRSVTFDNGVSLRIGQDVCFNAQGESVLLNHAPVIVEEKTYVPLSFFKAALGLANAQVTGNAIVIGDQPELADTEKPGTEKVK